MNVRPLHDRIIVHRLEEAEQQIGGIIIPDTAKEKPVMSDNSVLTQPPSYAAAR